MIIFVFIFYFSAKILQIYKFCHYEQKTDTKQPSFTLRVLIFISS